MQQEQTIIAEPSSTSIPITRVKGEAPVKPEYIISTIPTEQSEEDNPKKRKQQQSSSEQQNNNQQKKTKSFHNRTREARKNKKNQKQDSEQHVENDDNKDNNNNNTVEYKRPEGESNFISIETMKKLRKKEYPFDKLAIPVQKHVEEYMTKSNELKVKLQNPLNQLKLKQQMIVKSKELNNIDENKYDLMLTYKETKFKPNEFKKIDFSRKTYLAPLTTVGNLPFRRLCKDFGCEITVGEMALTNSILKGERGDISLLRRHESEKIFGVQLAGSDPLEMCKISQLIMEEFTNIDFVDINCGCPVQGVCKFGMGSGLMEKKNKLISIVRGMKEILNIPVTVKTRTGLKNGKYFAHKLYIDLIDAGANALTLHGRTKEQRYTKEADWNYIYKCSNIVKLYQVEKKEKHIDVSSLLGNNIPIKAISECDSIINNNDYILNDDIINKYNELENKTYIIGNGDVLSYQDWYKHLNYVDSMMIGRGALIKPWLFKEIEMQQDLDISSSERLEMLKTFVKYGLDHYGGDEQGIEKTRRYLLEWLSFLYRYIPVGLLERLPQKINERPPLYRGRDELETLMASSNALDWVRLTELAGLPKVSDDFVFVAKHKSNSYEVDDSMNG
ncbi:hypothetical protein ABK040_010827 [Willaertia magna]